MALSTLGVHDPTWCSSFDEIESGPNAAIVAQVLRRAHKYPVVVLNGSERRDQVLAVALASLPRAPVLIVTDATWKVETRSWVQRAQLRAIQRLERADIRYCVLSNFEKTRFPQTWNVDPDRMIFTPWMYTLSDEELAADVDESGGVVSGGDSLRDYRAY